jgi:hypothetical protein
MEERLVIWRKKSRTITKLPRADNPKKSAALADTALGWRDKLLIS